MVHCVYKNMVGQQPRKFSIRQVHHEWKYRKVLGEGTFLTHAVHCSATLVIANIAISSPFPHLISRHSSEASHDCFSDCLPTIFYHPRSGVVYNFGRVCLSVCICVCEASRKSQFLQCKTSITHNSGSIKDGAMSVACIIGFSAMTDRMAWQPSLSRNSTIM